MARKVNDDKKKKNNYAEVNASEDITVRMYDPGKNRDRASASLTIDAGGGHVVIYGTAVKGKNGWFFSFPSYKNKDGEYKNLVYAIEKDVTDAISEALEEAAEEYGVES